MANHLIINGSAIKDIATFYAEINRVFMQGEDWQLGESLDAFDDLLYGGFGSIDNGAVTEIVWNDIEVSKTALGYNATKAWYMGKLVPESVFNKKYFQDQLAKLEAGTGKTYFEIILEIIADHPNIVLIKR